MSDVKCGLQHLGMTVCPVCQTENSKDTIHCKGCGTKISLALEAARRVEAEDKTQGRNIPSKKKESSEDKILNKERSEMIWYYATNGNRIGPVSPNDLQDMYKSETLSSNSKVWKLGMPDWVELSQANVIDMENTPPPLVGSDINNIYAWALAIVPIVLASITIGLLRNQITNDISLSTIVIALLTVVLWILDKAALKKAGYKSSGWMYTVLLLTPLYLFIRAHRTGKKYGYAICWCVLFAFLIIVANVVNLHFL